MQHPVDAEAHLARVAPRLHVDVARALVERVLPQPVDDVDDVLVVRVELLVRLADLDQLLEVADAGALLARLGRAFHRFRQVVELDLVAADVQRIGDHAADLQPQYLLQLLFPVLHVGLGGRDRHFARVDRDREDLEARRVVAGHHLGHRGEIDLERIDVEVFHPGLAGEPLGEPFEEEDLVRGLDRAPLLVGDHYERVVIAAMQPAISDELVRVRPGHEPFGDEGLQHLGQREAVILYRFCGSLHGGEYSQPPLNGQAF